LILTGGDDGIARVWDMAMEGKEPVVEFDDGRDCPVTAVEWSGDGNQCFVGGVDNDIKVSVRLEVLNGAEYCQSREY
jgi:Prp8 binding protein